MAMVFQTNTILQLPQHQALLAEFFFATLASYNFHWLMGNAYRQGEFSVKSLLQSPTALVLWFIGVIGTVVFFIPSGINFWMACVAGVLTLSYSIPLLPIQQFHWLRKPGILKTLLLPFSWAVVTVLLPLGKIDAILQLPVLALFVHRCCFVFILCVIFDNRDIAVDKINGLHSLSTDWLPWKIHLLVIVALLVLLGLNVYIPVTPASIYLQLSLHCTVLVTGIVYLYALKKRGYLFYYFITDGMMLFSTILTTLATI
ncbi:MAG: hypothetical protein ACOYKE_10365 [Ferruginibacter sp.]